MGQVVKDTIETSIKDRGRQHAPGVLETGERARPRFNGERRDTYRSAEDDTLTWYAWSSPASDARRSPELPHPRGGFC